MATFKTTDYKKLITAIDENAPDWVDSTLDICWEYPGNIVIDCDYVVFHFGDTNGRFGWCLEEGTIGEELVEEDMTDPIEIANALWASIDVWKVNFLKTFGVN